MDIAERVIHINQLIAKEELNSQKKNGSVKLLGVSKGHSVKEIKEAFAAGLRDFGESYLQEAQPKIKSLTKLPICWHFIGPIQSNKTRGIAENFAWVQSVSRKKVAQLLNDARPLSLPPLNICIQVNFDAEETKTGTSPSEVIPLASHILQLPRLHLRGLMMIPKQYEDPEQQYLSFLRLPKLLQSINKTLNITMDTLSMGMSYDMQAAIRAGSTLVRVGTAIFGERKVI